MIILNLKGWKNDFKKLAFKVEGLSYQSLYGEYFDGYVPLFRVYRRNVSEHTFSYMTGLLKSERGKANMERIE